MITVWTQAAPWNPCLQKKNSGFGMWHEASAGEQAAHSCLWLMQSEQREMIHFDSTIHPGTLANYRFGVHWRMIFFSPFLNWKSNFVFPKGDVIVWSDPAVRLYWMGLGGTTSAVLIKSGGEWNWGSPLPATPFLLPSKDRAERCLWEVMETRGGDVEGPGRCPGGCQRSGFLFVSKSLWWGGLRSSLPQHPGLNRTNKTSVCSSLPWV